MGEYRYLGCVINEHVESKVMVDSRARAGARAQCACVRRCRVADGEVQGASFLKLLEAMVESVLLYGVNGDAVSNRGSRAGAVESSQDLPMGWAVPPKSGPLV